MRPNPLSAGAALSVAAFVLIFGSACTDAPTTVLANPPAETSVLVPPAAAYKNASYEIEGRMFTLTNGLSEIEAAPGSASKITTRFFGNEAVGDFNGDGTQDVAFVLTHSTGGAGSFYYATVALKTPHGYIGTNAVLLGDRIAPQSTSYRDGKLEVTYADRQPGEPMTARPSVGVPKHLKLDNGKLVVVQR